jgi:sialic acid synthase SpsE/quercetin dioxygenase-like cupin family protein
MHWIPAYDEDIVGGPSSSQEGEIVRLSDVKPLFVLEMANNHMGSLEHGLRIVRAFAEVKGDFPYTFAFKLQYRHLDTFIHPDYRGSGEFHYVKRFEETRLRPEEFKALRDEIGAQGFLAMCTAFDEASVDLVEEHDYDIVKIASCSFTDWPLLERVVLVDKPIIASCAGAPLDDIDRVVSFFEHRGKDFALMHCVAEYPVATDSLQLGQIDLLKNRYPEILVGYSTHEDPGDTLAVQMAVAMGASILEKHVGVPTDEIKLNAYSADPGQVRAWLAAADEAVRAFGIVGERCPSSEAERASLLGLRRGVFARRSLQAGKVLGANDVFLAIPTFPGQLTANDLSKYTEYTLSTDVAERAPILLESVSTNDHREQVRQIIDDVKDLLHKSGLAVPAMVDLEISHHYGLEHFSEFGLTMLSIVNREYCKKLLIMLPGQSHPVQYHEEKEETFHVLYGEVDLKLGDSERVLSAGDVVTVERGVHHAFGTRSGAIIEEISTTHQGQDCFYLDPAVMGNPNRKTFVTYWMA